MNTDKISAEHLKRRAVVYVRQSTQFQVRQNQESTRLQYGLADRARSLGFTEVDVIDADLGKSGSGLATRAGFDSLVGAVCAGDVGAVLCIEEARLARNGREWHHLIELCALTGTLLIDPHGIYDPRIAQDRLMLGVKGSMAEFELSLFRQRSLEAIRAKASRGELRLRLPAGLLWTEENKIEIDPDQRVQDALRTLFRKFDELGSSRKVLRWFHDSQVSMPVFNTGGTQMTWKVPGYATVLSTLSNPFYCGAYAFGRTEVRRGIVDGRPFKSGGHRKPRSEWRVLIRDHHPGYISWAEYERNQRVLTDNAFMVNSGSRKAGRGGRALLAGLLRCGRCGRRLGVMYKGSTNRVPRYLCDGAHWQYGTDRCISFGGLRVDEAISVQIVRSLEPHAIEAAIRAADEQASGNGERRRAMELELEDARYASRLAARRYEAVDPEKRLVAAELEGRWNEALDRVATIEQQLRAAEIPTAVPAIDRDGLMALAEDLPKVWNAPSVDPRLKQRIAALVIEEVVADVDRDTGEIVLVVHWAGGQHSELRVAKNKAGHTGHWTDPDAKKIMERMAGRWPDRDIALTLNRLQIRTGTGLTWTDARVRSICHRLGLAAYDPHNANHDAASLHEAAGHLGISSTAVRSLINRRELSATQVAPGAPWQILREDLERPEVIRAVQAVKSKTGRSRTRVTDNATPRIPGL
jgi:DNA invertase Pin-like site-specific DNA recombinase